MKLNNYRFLIVTLVPVSALSLGPLSAASAEPAQPEAEVMSAESIANQAEALDVWAAFWAKEQAAASEESVPAESVAAEIEDELDLLPVGMDTSEDTMHAISPPEFEGAALPPPYMMDEAPSMAQTGFTHDQWVEHGELPAAKSSQRSAKRPTQRQATGHTAEPQPAAVPRITVEQRLQALQQRRVSGELTGDEYLAERRRFIDGE